MKHVRVIGISLFILGSLLAIGNNKSGYLCALVGLVLYLIGDLSGGSAGEPELIELLDQDVAIPELDGTGLIGLMDNNSGFFGVEYVDMPFIISCQTKKGLSMPATSIDIFGVTGYTSDSYLKIFGSLPGTWDDKWLTEHQVAFICCSLRHRCLSRTPWNATVFLCKRDENAPVDENRPGDNLFVVRAEDHSSSGLYFFWSELEINKDGRDVLREQDRVITRQPILVSE